MISLLISFGVLIVGYAVYGRVVEKVFSPDDRQTPAVAIHDGVDCVPLKTDPATLSFETHEKFFDIQYLVEGVELLGACTRQGLVVKTPYDTANDVTFYEDPDHAGQVLLRGDDYVIFAPEDAHKPRCQAGAPLPVKKIVVKVPV
jgi:YhcH/YjgK/YiaL family protein